MTKRIVLFAAIFCFAMSMRCVNYRAGNRLTLDYDIDTKLSLSIVREYLDTLTKLKEYQIPVSWRQYDKLVDITPETTWRIYLRDYPQEMYLIQISGVLLLADVYNPSIIKDDYISTRDRMPVGEEERVRKRFREEILSKIEQMAKQNGCPDSVLYFKPNLN